MMSYSTTGPPQTQAYCSQCNRMLQAGMAFCGLCGSPATPVSNSYDFAAQGTAQLAHAPSFAPISQRHINAPDPKLQAEALKLMVLIARERVFLYLHYLIAFAVQAVGFWIAMKCYYDYI